MTGRRPIIWTNAAFLILMPLVTIIAVPWYALKVGVEWAEIIACVSLWLIVGLSITAGYHRLFSHRAYSASAPVRALFAIIGAAALENSIIAWAAAHRYHHRFVDSDDDPYNPQEGFWYSHMGWIMVEGAKHDDTANVDDLRKDPICRWQHRHYLAVAIGVNLLLTAALAWMSGRVLGMIVFALLLRIVLTHHFTFLINSAAHMWGSRRWSTEHSARDNWLLSFLTFGEGYHNYHHTFQTDYRNGTSWYNWDPSKWLIWLLARFRLAGNLKRSAIDVQMKRLFVQAKRSFELRLELAGQTLDELRDRTLTSVGETAGAIILDQFDLAERRCEEAFAELKAARARWQSALQRGGRWFPEARSFRRQMVSAQRAARHAIRQWQEVSTTFLATAT